MTTIAYRAGLMASDSMLSESDADNGFVVGCVNKLYTLPDGSLLGLSGDAEADDVIEALAQVTDRDPVAADLAHVDAECEGILVKPDGRTFWLSTAEEGYAAMSLFIDKFAAVGTGKWIAYGAMEFGASAEQAVECACRRHCFSRGPVQSKRLESYCDVLTEKLIHS